jgi:glutamate/tyrosine decarboxylase-like PLP-dependent enzyme
MQDPTDPSLERAFHHARRYLASLDERPAAAPAGADALRRGFFRDLPDEGCDPAEVIDELVAAAEPGLHGNAGGRFFGWVIGGVLPAALGADWLTSVWDQNATAFAVSPAGAIVEEAVGVWLKDLLGLPAGASFALVTGCEMAHVTCLLAARNGLLAQRGWDVERQGLFGAPRIRIVTSDLHHPTLDRAARFVGFGADAIVNLPAGEDGTLPPDALAAALEGEGPTIVVLQAGELNTGAFDDFQALVPIAHRAGAWVHVDGAFGLWCAASPGRRRLVEGVEAADSWATDAHKWLNTPYDCGLAFTAHPDAHRASMQQHASYMAVSPARDQSLWTPEYSRRARGFAVYAALRELGRKGLADLIDRTSEHCRALTYGIGALEGAEQLSDPKINQGLVRFLDLSPHAAPEDHDRRTEAVIRAVCASGKAFFGPVTWRGMRAARVSVCNWRTTGADIERTIAAVAAALRDS